MNREIKFRGKGYSGWFYGYVQEYHEKFCKRICVCPVSIRTSKDSLLYEVKEETIGQFTGLHDKNGKEIYEGDTIKITGSNEAKHVAYSDKEAAFGIQYPNGDFFAFVFDITGISEDCFEIIGNIHDNPELLEDKK